jgi:hypothetical protein
MAASLTPQFSQPPPLPHAEGWYIGVGEERQGPFDLTALQGRITPETLVWTAGMAQWARAAEVPELAAILASTPPPLP